MSSQKRAVPKTPDGKYIVVRGRLWRTYNPALSEEKRQSLVDDLMDARRAVKDALASENKTNLKKARARVQSAKEGLGERGPVWWSDGAPDYNRHLAKNTPLVSHSAVRAFGSIPNSRPGV